MSAPLTFTTEKKTSSSIIVNYDGQSYSLEPSAAEGSTLKAFRDYTGTGWGVYQTFTLGDYICDIGVKLSKVLKLSAERIQDLTNISSKISSSKSLMVVTSITSSSGSTFFENLSSCIKSGFSSTRLEDFVYSVLDLTDDLITFVSFFRIPKAALFFLGKTSGIISFIKNSWDLKSSTDEYSRCQEMEKKAKSFTDLTQKSKIETYVTERKRYLMMSVACSVIDYVGYIFFYVGIFFGVALVPAAVTWGLGVISFGVYYYSDIYEKSMTYELKDVDQDKKSVV